MCSSSFKINHDLEIIKTGLFKNQKYSITTTAINLIIQKNQLVFYQIMQSLQAFYCSAGDISQNICVTPGCKSYPFTCDKQNCSCHQKHFQCSEQFQTKQFIDTLTMKINKSNQSISTVVEYYDYLIKTLTIQRQELMGQVESKLIQGGMEKEEYELFSLMTSKAVVDVTGELVERIITRWEQNKFKQLEYYSRTVNNQLKRIKSAIEPLLAELKDAVVLNMRASKIQRSSAFLEEPKKPKQHEILSQIRSCKLRQIKINDQEIDRNSDEIELKKVTNISLQHITPTVIHHLEQYCPNLKRLLIELGVTDSICSELAASMTHLKQLIILSSLISDVGAVELAGSLQNLEYLQMTHSNITENGKKLIKTLFPKGKTLKF